MTGSPQERARTSARRATKKAKSAASATKKDLSMEDLKGFSPVLVGLLRGLIHAMLMAGITYITTQLGNLQGAGAVGTVAVIAVGAVRSVEGILDKVLLGAPPQARLLGGKDVGS